MAGEYGVNINLRVKGQSGLDRLKTKVNELSASVDKIRGIDIMNPRNVGGKGGKADRNQIKKYRKDMEDLVKSVNKSKGAFGKTANQQMAAAEALQEYANNLKIGTKEHKAAIAATEKQVKAINSETTAIDKNNKMQKKNRDLASRIGGMFGKKKGKGGGSGMGDIVSSALVSGAFPLLFGQGLLGGAFGAVGGGVGAKFGGQMGGFAGGLVATAVLQQITTLVTNINALGNAFNELNPNIEQLTTSLGIAGTVEAERLKILEQSEGRHVALAAATEKMNQAIGENGVKNLKEFAESSRLLGNSFKLAMTKMQAALAPFFKFFANMAGGITGATQKRDSELLTLAEGQGGARVDELNALRERLSGIKSTKQNRAKRNILKSRIAAIEKELIAEGKLLEMAQLRNDQFDLATKAIRDQNIDLENQINLGRLGAEVEREKKRIAKEMGIAVKDLTPEMLKQIDDNIKLRDALEKTLALYQGIAATIETGIVDALEGAINGTRTLGDVARSVFGSIQRQLLDFGVNAFLQSIPGFGSFFKRANGGPVSAGQSYMVGERGPEMFVPNAGGRIVSNEKTGAATTNIVVNVDASGSGVEGDEQDGRELGLLISAAVQSEIIQQQRPGGLLA